MTTQQILDAVAIKAKYKNFTPCEIIISDEVVVVESTIGEFFFLAISTDTTNIKVGDVIISDNSELVNSVIYNNPSDLRAYLGNRVTINGLHWYKEDVKYLLTDLILVVN